VAASNWHFADIGAFHAAILRTGARLLPKTDYCQISSCVPPKRTATPAVAAPGIRGKLALENAVRTWATVDPAARAAVQPLTPPARLCRESLQGVRIVRRCGASPCANFYWAFLAFAFGQALAPERQAAVLDELVRMASR